MRSVWLLCGFGCLAAIALLSNWSTTRHTADFAFCNSADVESLDPAKASDSSAHRVLSGVFEGLCVLHPETLEPQPGMATNLVRGSNGQWLCQSDDGKTLTFRLRDDALWSDGSPVLAADFVYSFRRTLDPLVAAPYPHLLGDHVVNAEKYNAPRMLQVGDPVEVELPLAADQPENSNRRGAVVQGVLLANNGGTYEIEIDGQARKFAAELDGAARDVEPCRQVLLDFRQVGIRAVDERTLEIQLIRANPSFLQVLAHVTLSPVKQQCLEAHPGTAWTKPEHLVCNGPYLVQERRLRDRIRLSKNPTYWDQANIKCEIVDALTVESPATMLNLFEAGQVDWIPSVPTSLVDDLRRTRSAALRTAPAFSTYFYVFNVKQPPFDDPHVRRAFARAVRRQVVIDTALRGGQLPAAGFVPHGVVGYSRPSIPAESQELAAEEMQQAAEAARELLKTGQWKLLYNTGETHRSIAELIQSQWRDALGVDVQLENREFGAFRAAIAGGEFDIARSGWTGDVSDPIAFLHMFASDSPFNDAGWSNAEYDRLLELAGMESAPARRLELLSQAEAILLDECPVIPIYHRVSTHLVKPDVQGFFSNPSDVHPLKWIRRAD